MIVNIINIYTIYVDTIHLTKVDMAQDIDVNKEIQTIKQNFCNSLKDI